MSSERPGGPAENAPSDADLALPPLAARWLVRAQVLLGAGAVAAGGAVVATGATVPGAVMLAASAVQLGAAWHVGRHARGGQVLGAARDAIDLGELDEAERLLDRAETFGAAARREAQVVRAGLRLQRDDHAGAAALAAEVLQDDGKGRARSWAIRLEAHGIRALARAATGDAAGAVESATEVDAMIRGGADASALALGAGHVVDEARARAALAVAVGLAREGDRDALRSHLAAHEATLHSATRPRERALLRGIERMLASERSSPYRGADEAAREVTDGDDWLASMLPDVAPFVRTTGAGGALPLPHLATAPLARAAGDWSSARRIATLVAAWVAVAVASFAANFVDIPGTTPNGVFLLTMTIPVLFALGIVGFAVGRGVGTVSRRQALADAIVLARATGDFAFVEALAGAPEPHIAAQAMLVLAHRHNLAGEFVRAKELATEGLLRTRAFLRRAETETDVRPGLLAELALARAGLGDASGALAAVESIEAGFAHRARARYAVRLVALAASGDVAGATELAERRPTDLALDRPIEALADVLRTHAVDGRAGLAERTRVEAELKRCADLRAWVGRIVPRIIDEMDLEPVSGPRIRLPAPVEVSAVDVDVDGESENEALAAEELAHARRSVGRSGR